MRVGPHSRQLVGLKGRFPGILFIELGTEVSRNNVVLVENSHFDLVVVTYQYTNSAEIGV